MRVADLPFVANGCFNRTLGDTAQLSPLSAARAKVAHSSQGFVEIMKSVKGVPDDDEDEEEEYLDGNRDNKKEGSSHKGSSQQRMQLERFRRELSNGDVGAKVDGKNTDQRASTPRSKHSATEQRRRSKINERFQILRELVPHSDHKRDKASFLLEVIDYIQILQEKVQKYEVPCQGWNQDKMKMMPWKNSQGPGVNTADHSRRKQNSPGPGFIFTGKFDGSSAAATPEMVMSSCNPPESDSTGTFAPYKNMELHPSLLSKAVGVATPLQPCVYTPVPRNSSLAQHQQRLVLDVENMATPPQPQFQQRPFPVDCPIQNDASNEQEELVVEGGMISISSLYSQGLLGALTQALQSSGLDLSQANISVQIDLGKQGTSRPSTTTSSAKDEDPSSNRAVAHSRAASSGGDSEQAQKRPKTDRGG